MNDNGMITFGRYEDRSSNNKNQPARLPIESFKDMTVITGSEDSNKRNLVNNIAYQAMKSGESVVHIADSEESSEQFVNIVPKDRTSDVLCISPAKEEYDDVGFNIINSPVTDGNPRYEEVVSETVDSFTTLLKEFSDS